MSSNLYQTMPQNGPVRGAERPALHGGVSEGVLWLNWVGANAVGELVGLGAVAAIAMLAGPALLGDEETLGGRLLFALVMIAAGAVEGLVVGVAQWRVLRRPFPALPRQAWLRATIAGAVIAWVLGMLPSILLSGSAPDGTVPPTLDRTTVYLLAAAMGAALGAVLGFPQSRVLRSHVERSGLWIAANALAWAVAMPVVFLGAGSVGRMGASTGPILFGMGTILLAGAICGAIHGTFLIRLVRETGSSLRVE